MKYLCIVAMFCYCNANAFADQPRSLISSSGSAMRDPLIMQTETSDTIATPDLPKCTSEMLKNTDSNDKNKDGCFCKNVNSYDYQAQYTHGFCKLTHDPSFSPCCWQGKIP